MRRRPKINAAAPFRATVADAAFAVEQRLVWRGADLLRGVAEAVKWPFERAVWTLERGVVWPIEERTDGWDGSLRAASVGGLTLLAAGAVALGVLVASGTGTTTQLGEVSAPAPAPASLASQPESESVLHGAAPDFTPASDEAASKVAGSEASSEATVPAEGTPLENSTAATAAPVVPAGPAATKIAHRFASAFVLYETGKTTSKVRTTFAETATPQLARALLRRPPRLPANTEVPKAKVVNIVPGPKRGDSYTMSISLLRVGITSELRIDMEREKESGEFKVGHIDG